MQRADGMNYAPTGRPDPVCGQGDFRFGVIGLDHGHIYGMCNGLIEAGAEIKWVYDPDPAKVAAFCKKYEQVKKASSEEEILEEETPPPPPLSTPQKVEITSEKLEESRYD